MVKPYNVSVEEMQRMYATDNKRGLSTQEAKKRLNQYGFNELPAVGRESWLSVFLQQFQNPLIYILLIAATIIYFVGPDKYDAFIISGVLLFNAIIGTIQEGRTHSILEALSRFIKVDTLVMRDGKHLLVSERELVPGDLILLREGQRVAADARVIISNNLRVDESALTGESQAVTKTERALIGDKTVFEQANMVFQGTYIVAGSGCALVVATGRLTELGKIHGSIVEAEVQIPLRQELERLSYHILLGILGLCMTLLMVGLVSGKPFRELLVMLTALFICVIPEGLPVVLTLVLASGVYRMAKKNVLIKNLQAVEGLGRTDVILIDKTGTLTRNEMVVSQVYADERMYTVSGHGYDAHDGALLYQDVAIERPVQDTALWYMGVATSLLNSAEIVSIPERDLFEIKGDPTEAALYVFSQKLGFTKQALEAQYTLLYEIPFDSKYRYHAGFYRLPTGDSIVFITGSPELITARSTVYTQATAQVLSEQLGAGLRVVALAMKRIQLDALPSAAASLAEQDRLWRQLVESELTFLGLCAIEDAIRTNVAQMVTQARDAGLQVVMATGDHYETALYIARKTGIFRQGDRVLEGSALAAMSDIELAQQIRQVSVYARVTPDQKLRIVKAFQQLGLLVAMTGDGINDAPALVAADIGIGMGRIGTEVAKQASDMILLDDSFESIINALEQGRHIFYTLRRVILYFFATNMGEVLIVLFALVAGLPLPITAAQILWLNLVTDGFLDIALSMEPQEGSLLGARWRYRGKHLVDGRLWLNTMFMALPMGLGSLLIFVHYYKHDMALARTMALLTLAMFQWFNALSCRSTNKSVFQLGFLSNPWLLGAMGLVACLQLVLIYTPWMRAIFHTVPLTVHQLGLVVLVSSSVLILEELRKIRVRRYERRRLDN